MPLRALIGAILFTTAAAASAAPGGPLRLRDVFDPSAQGPIHDAHAFARQAEAEAGAHDRPATFDVASYDLALTVDPTVGTIRGRATVDFKSLVRVLDRIELDAVDMRIDRVEDAGGRELRFAYDGSLLAVQLGAALAGGERGLVTVHYQALLSQALFLAGPEPGNTTQAVQAYTYTEPEGAREWFPCVDRPADKATLRLGVAVPAGFRAVSNGDLAPSHGASREHVFEYRMEQQIATYLVSLAIGPYEQVAVGDFKGKPIHVYSPPALAAKAKATTANTPGMMAAFSAFTGVDYPFNTYSMAVAESYGTSMEHQSATTMGGTRITGDASGEGVVAHELAHQWFGDHVTCRNWGEIWLNEGFATYLPYVYFTGLGASAEPRAVGQLEWWRGGYFGQAATTVHALSSPDPDFGNLFDSHAYEKGALVVHLMRHLANALPSSDPSEEAFTRVLRLYQQQNAQGTATSYELQTALEKVTGTSWQPFFDQWVRSPGHPVVTVTTAQADGQLVVTVDQTQATRAERRWRTFAFPLELEILSADGTLRTEVVQVYDERQVFTLPQATPATAISVDPRWLVPMQVTFAQTAAQWTAVLARRPSL